jgi:hypothetical protein
MLLLFRHITALQPRVLLFWDTAAWHMAWNASVAAMNDRNQPRLALRVKAQREYFALGKDFLERGIENNPDVPTSTRRWRGYIRRNTKTTNAPPSIMRRRQRCRERRHGTGVSRPTSSECEAASAKRTNACAAL